MKIRPEHIIAITSLVLVFLGFACQLASSHWGIHYLHLAALPLLIGGIAVAFLPLVVALIFIGLEKIRGPKHKT